MLSETTFGRGFSLQIFPCGEKGWGAVELQVLDSKLSLDSEMWELPGDSSMRSFYRSRPTIKMEIEAESGELMMFETFEILEGWLKTRCNKLWPSCGYCGRRYVANEVVCSGCGGPRGDS